LLATASLSEAERRDLVGMVEARQGAADEKPAAQATGQASRGIGTEEE
jgi:hypothetical protein